MKVGPGQRLRILQVDDHPLYRQGLSNHLQLADTVESVMEAATAEEAVEKLAQYDFDAVITDHRLPGRSGCWLVEQIKSGEKKIPVLVVSNYQDDNVVLEALEAGADGFLVKTASGDDVLEALQAVVAGRPFLHAPIQHVVLKQLRQSAPKPVARTEALTEKEQQTLELLVRGLTPQEVAETLVVSLNTVKTHLRSLYRKYDVRGRADLLFKAMSDTAPSL